VCGTGYEAIAADGRRLRTFEKPATDQEIRDAFPRTIPFLCASLMVRRETLGGERFRPFFDRLGCEDFDLAARLLDRARAANLPEPLYGARVVPGSFSRTRRGRRQAYAADIVRALARERDGGRCADALMRGDETAMETLLTELDRPYREDPAREFRERAGALLSVGEARTAVAAALRAVAARPLASVNYRALGYALRVALGIRHA
jgi:hypothetical protein